MNERDSNRLSRLERRTSHLRGKQASDEVIGVSEFLRRDDPVRLAAFLAAAKRSGFCEEPPDMNDDSQLAQFLRVAWKCELIRSEENQQGPSGFGA